MFLLRQNWGDEIGYRYHGRRGGIDVDLAMCQNNWKNIKKFSTYDEAKNKWAELINEYPKAYPDVIFDIVQVIEKVNVEVISKAVFPIHKPFKPLLAYTTFEGGYN